MLLFTWQDDIIGVARFIDACLKQVLIPITQILQCRALEHNVLLISSDALLAQCTESVEAQCAEVQHFRLS